MAFSSHQTDQVPVSAECRHRVGDMMLDDEQYDVCCAILRDDQPNVLLTGVPGAGKTALITNLRAHLIRTQTEYNLRSMDEGRYDEAEDAARALYPITAMTGMARQNIGDDCTTLHAFLGMGSPDSLEALLKNNKDWFQKMWPDKLVRLRTAQKLFIEECFMLTLGYWAVLDHVLRRVRGSPRPFGGLQMIMFGDAFQLGPVYTNKSPEYRQYNGVIEDIPLFSQTELYTAAGFEEFHLTKSYRQISDVHFARVLSRVRNNSPLNDDLVALSARNKDRRKFMVEYYKSHGLKWEQDGVNIEPTLLSISNVGAKTENIDRLLGVKGELRNFTGYFLLTGLDYKALRTATSGAVHNVRDLHTLVTSFAVAPRDYVKSGSVLPRDLEAHGFDAKAFAKDAVPSVDVVHDGEVKLQEHDRRALATKLLTTHARTGVSLPLKVGAQVVLTQNLAAELDLVNGTRGVVVAFREDAATAAASATAIAEALGRMTKGGVQDDAAWEVEVCDMLAGERTPQLWPEVKFTNGRTQLITPMLIDLGATLPDKFPRERRSGEPIRSYLVALPLLLAYSFTIHSFQGRTLDFGIVVCGERMAPGQAYTAFSRFCKITDFATQGFTPRSIIAHPKAIEYEAGVLARCAARKKLAAEQARSVKK